jgi:hypothetical protein
MHPEEIEISHERTHRWWYDRAQKAKNVTTYYSRKSVQIFILTILRLGVILTFFSRKYTIRLIEHVKERIAPMPKTDGGISETPISQFLETLNEYKKKLREFHQELEENHEVKNEERQLTETKEELQ